MGQRRSRNSTTFLVLFANGSVTHAWALTVSAIPGAPHSRIGSNRYRYRSAGASIGPRGVTPVAVKRDARVSWFSTIGDRGSNPSPSSEESSELGPGPCRNSAGLRGRGYAAFTGRFGRPRRGRAGRGTQGHQRRVGAGRFRRRARPRSAERKSCCHSSWILPHSNAWPTSQFAAIYELRPRGTRRSPRAGPNPTCSFPRADRVEPAPESALDPRAA